jgi:uridine kinase
MKSSSDLLYHEAHQVLTNAVSGIGIRASFFNTDNYNRVWARDSAVSALAIFSSQLVDLYPTIRLSIINLNKAASSLGQIPSNVAVAADHTISSVSFGGPVGRTDSSFWWIIMATQYLHQNPDDFEIKELCFQQSSAIFKLAEAWEFNGKHLMYVPMSGNWADEYVTHGYVLYDQLLRFWALELAGNLYQEAKWIEKATRIKTAIKIHYLLEGELDHSIFTEAQKKDLVDFDLTKNFIASFSPGDRVEKYDAWSIALLFLLKIPSAASSHKLESAIKNIFKEASNRGIPAFFPLINEDDLLYQSILMNHHYKFKNYPGHFHNGGIWPVVNGFLIAGLNHVGFNHTAQQIMEALTQNLSSAQNAHPFAEYFDFHNGLPAGVDQLCYSASGYLLAFEALNNKVEFSKSILFNQPCDNDILAVIRDCTQKIINKLDLNSNKKTAISISGESGCGKTTLSISLKTELEKIGFKVLILHQDDYFKLPPKQNHQARFNNFDHIGLQEVRFDLIDEHINIFKEGIKTTLEIPKMDWILDEEKLINAPIQNINIIIIEGTYTALLNKVDKRIFINTNYMQTKQNRVSRNRETVTDFIEKVLAKESEIIKEHKKFADIVLNQQFEIN